MSSVLSAPLEQDYKILNLTVKYRIAKVNATSDECMYKNSELILGGKPTNLQNKNEKNQLD